MKSKQYEFNKVLGKVTKILINLYFTVIKLV